MWRSPRCCGVSSITASSCRKWPHRCSSIASGCSDVLPSSMRYRPPKRRCASKRTGQVAEISTKPYLTRALYEWCADSGFTPQLLVAVDARTRVPPGYVKDGQIVLNISAGATRNLTLDNDWIQFSARFGGVSHEIAIPVDRVAAIFARENGQGLHFEPAEAHGPEDQPPPAPEGEPPAPRKGRPSLKIVK